MQDPKQHIHCQQVILCMPAGECVPTVGCTAENKAKPMWNSSNKGNYPGLVCA